MTMKKRPWRCFTGNSFRAACSKWLCSARTGGSIVDLSGAAAKVHGHAWSCPPARTQGELFWKFHLPFLIGTLNLLLWSQVLKLKTQQTARWMAWKIDPFHLCCRYGVWRGVATKPYYPLHKGTIPRHHHDNIMTPSKHPQTPVPPHPLGLQPPPPPPPPSFLGK